MKRLALLATLAIATPAAAQVTWYSHQSGSERHYTGYDQNGGGAWTGISRQSGSDTITNFYGPSGQSKTCYSHPSGSETITNCY